MRNFRRKKSNFSQKSAVFYNDERECGFIMINRSKWGNLYWRGRGEILWSFQDTLLRKHFTKMFSLIKDEGCGREDD